MRDKNYGLFDKCPRCGKSKGLYYVFQYPMIVKVTMKGKPFVFKNLVKKTRLSNRDKARYFDEAFGSEVQYAMCKCDLCGWKSEEVHEIIRQKKIQAEFERDRIRALRYMN